MFPSPYLPLVSFILFAARPHISFFFILAVSVLYIVHQATWIFFKRFFKDCSFQLQKQRWKFITYFRCWTVRNTVLYLVLGIIWFSSSSVFLLYCLYQVPLTDIPAYVFVCFPYALSSAMLLYSKNGIKFTLREQITRNLFNLVLHYIDIM